MGFIGTSIFLPFGKDRPPTNSTPHPKAHQSMGGRPNGLDPRPPPLHHPIPRSSHSTVLFSSFLVQSKENQQMLIGNNNSNEQYDPVHSQQSINNLNYQSLQQQQQQKKRRSAAERRASHRRRSSQNEIQLAQKKLQRRNSDLEEEQGNGNLPAAFSPIPEPPEPAIPAPGGEEDEIEDAFNVLGELDQNGATTTDENGMDDEELAASLMRKECLSPETVVLNNSSHHNFAAFTPLHQRSISDHIVHSAQSIRRRQRQLSPGQVKIIQKPPFSPGLDQNAETPTRKTTLPEQMVNESTGHLPIKQLPYEEYSPAESGRDSSPSTGDTSILANIAKSLEYHNNFEHCLGPNTSTSGILQLVSKFSTYRQHSAGCRPNKKLEGPARRSFKLKSFWERRGTENDCGNGKTGHKLCSLPEDVESADLVQKKRHSAILNDENQHRKGNKETSTIRLRTSSNCIENGIALQPRPFSIIGTQDELAKYRVADEEWTRFQQFVQEKAAGEEKLPSKEEWDDSLDFLDGQLPAQPPPRMNRHAPVSPVYSYSSQTLGRKQKLQRAATSNRADLQNNIYVPLTLPRKKARVPAQQRRKPMQIMSHSAARRKSIVNIKELAEIAAILANEKQPEEQQNKQIVVEKLVKRARNKSSLKQLLGAAGGERNRAKVAPKIAQINTKGDKMDMANLVVERSERDNRKRENKANSMILGTIWSIRQRRKKEGGTPRALTNLWGTGHGFGGLAEKEKGGGKPPTENGDFIGRIPNTMEKSTAHPSATLQSPLSPLLASQSPFNTSMDEFNANSSTASLFPSLQLVQPKWEDLDLWTNQAANWATKFGEHSAGLGEKDLKRQNVIYELVLTERHHCQVLVLLQCYRENLIYAQLLTNDQLKILIPDVLNALLDFHLALIRRLIERCSLQPIVDEIGDILLDEFEFGQHRSEAIQAYTTFCLARENSIRHFGHLMSEGSSKQFRRFMEFHESEHNKDRSFKDCLLLIAQRLTKYPVLVEQMAKLESRMEQREIGQKAHAAVRKFAMQVDQELLRHENDRQWAELKKVLDKSGSAKIIHPKEGKEFTIEDLAWPLENRTRRLELLTKVFWRETMNGPEMELRLLLCDDLILFLRPKGSSSSTNGNIKLPPLQFFRHSEHAGVFPLQSTLIKGKNTRRKSILLIQTAKQRPDLFELAFLTCNELEQFVQAIHKAKATAQKFIRLSCEKLLPLDDGPIREGHLEVRKAGEAEFLAKMDEWLREMDKLFEQRMNREAELMQYFEGRMEFMEQIQARLKRIPRRNNDDQKTLKLIEHLRNRFMELERTRTTSLNRLVERARLVKDANLFAIFDDVYDLGACTEDEQQHIGMMTVDSGSDEPRGSDSSEERRRIPRRVRTYHGTSDHRKKGDSGSSTGSGAGSSGGIRRHTTVPGRRSQMGGSSEEEEQQQREKDGKAARLLLRMEPAQRREEAAQLIRENVLLRSELNRLKAKTALQEIHLTAMRAKKGETNAEERTKKFDGESEEGDKTVRHAVMEQMMEELARKEADLERRETELKVKTKQLMATTNSSMAGILPAEPTNSFQQKEHRWDDMGPEEVGHLESSCQQQQIRIGQPQQNSIKISNTYCGAGPVPNSRSVENSPAQLATDRRAISQTELPLHLVVKTKQRRK